MTEEEWADCAEPGPMLEFLRGRASDRQLRLFACACCRSIQGFIPIGPCRDALAVSLRYADGEATADELAAARTAAISATDRAGPHTAAAWAACETTNPSAIRAARAASDEAREQLRRQSRKAAEDEARVQAGFLRDIVGDPFRPVRLERYRWLARLPLVREIAEEINSGGPQEDMESLANELQRQGCPLPAVVEHCRSAGPHVRGCWVIDLILGAGSEPPPAGVAEQVPAPRVPAPRVQKIREAFLHHLGPKKYRRCLRKAIAASPGPGRIGRLAEWDAFVHAHPEYEISDDELTAVCAVCCVHNRELVERLVCCQMENPQLARHPVFLEARGRQFPHSFPEEGMEWETEKLIWWCPECQQARTEWMRGRG